MHCSGLMIPGSETHCFFFSTTSGAPLFKPVLGVKPVTRIAVRPFKTKAAINARVAAELSFYDLLGVPESVTFPEIKQAYKQLARKYHPDVSPPDRVEEYTRRFIQVQEAYETLSDPSMRAIYDRDMARGLHLVLSSERRYQSQIYEEMETMSEWKNRWQCQLSELMRRNTNEAAGNMSWGARMRRKREELSIEV